MQTEEPEQSGERRVVVRRPGAAPYFIAAYHAPRATDLDFFACSVLSGILSGASTLTISRGASPGRSSRLYRALVAIPLPEKDPATRHYLERTLLEYRLAGVDKDDATRAKLRQLQDRVTALSLEFGRNVADGTLKVTATKAELEGLPDLVITLPPLQRG